jgi:hypothetical protein
MGALIRARNTDNGHLNIKITIIEMVGCTIIASDAEPRADQRILLSSINLSH